MKLTDDQIKIFIETFKDCLKNFIGESFLYEKEVVEYLKNNEVKDDFEIDKFGTDAFLIWVKTFVDHYSELEEAVKFTQNILNDKV
jgi:hypothetical protein